MTNSDRPTEASERLQARARRTLAAGVGSYARGTGAGYDRPIVADTASGARFRDVDGNEYIDYLMALGPLILGHQPPELRVALNAAFDRYGSMVGLSNELEARAAEAVVGAVPGVELVRFSNTGTEAAMMAVRVARASTGRPLVIKFEGAFHGWSDTLHWSVKPSLELAGSGTAPARVPAVDGVAGGAGDGLLIARWNDLPAVEALLAAHPGQVAAIITEPILANLGCVEPQPGYLAGLRTLADRDGALLIFDEVVTGFRVALGGAQQLYGVIPDLTVMAKAIGGGFPVAALGGRAEVMDVVATGRLPYLGTYNTNPPAMAAVEATIAALSAPGALERVEAMGRQLAEGLVDVFGEVGVPAIVAGVGSVFQVWFADHAPRDYREALALAQPTAYRAFHRAMLDRGVLVHPSQFEHLFVSTAHDQEAIDATIKAARLAAPRVAAVLA